MPGRDTAYGHWRAVGAVFASIGGAFLVALLGLPLATGTCPWDWALAWQFAYFAAIVLALLTTGAGVYVVLAPIYGWRVPLTHEEKQAIKQEREEEAIRRASQRRDALDETLAELARQDQLLRVELQEGRMYGALHDDTKWRKWEGTLFSEGLLDEIALTKEAHQLLKAISEEKRQRGLMADQNDPNSMRLTDEDSRARAEAAPIIASALEALHAAREKGS